jgi:hypothetical protein
MFRTPHFAILDDNPVFDFELRRIKHLGTPSRLWLYSVLVQVVPMALLSAGYLLGFAHAFQARVQAGNLGAIYGFGQAWESASVLLFGGAVLMALLGDLYYLMVSAYSINQQINNGHWDLLRLSPVSERAVLDAKEAVALIRAWRVMNVEVMCRLLLVTLGVLLATFSPQDIVRDSNLFGRYSFWGTLIGSFWQQPFNTSIALSTVLVTLWVWIVEPRWRMRSVVGLGLAISARVHSITMASVGALFGLLGFHILQAVVMFGVAWAMIGCLSSSGTVFGMGDCTLLWPTLLYLGYLAVGHQYYRLTRLQALQSALNQAFRADR